MSAYEIARDMSVGILTYVGATKWVSYMVGDNPYDKKLPWKVLAHILPVRIFEDGFFTSTTITTVATRVQNNTAAYETPYVWAREFLEEAGFNLTERIPAILGVHEYEIPGVDCRHNFLPTHLASAVPPHLIHELSLRWTVTLIGGIFQSLVKTIGEHDMVDLAWLLAVVLILVLLYLWRCHLVLMSSRVWEELKEDVATFVQQTIGPASKEVPAGTITISAADMEILKTSATAIEKRINYLRMSKFNFVRGRTGIVFNLNTFRKLQIQLTKAQEALKKEKAAKARPLVNFVRSRRPGVVFYSHAFTKLQTQLAEVRKALEEEKAGHQETQDFLDHQTNARANAEEELEELRARLETEEPEEEEENPQLETIEEAEEESPAADETEFEPVAEEEDPKLSTQLENSEESEEEASADQMGSQPEFEEGNPNLSTQLEGIEKFEEESVAEAADCEHDAEEEASEISTQLETIEESEAESPPEQTDAQADLTAEDEDNADRSRIERLQVQLNVEQANYRSVFQRKEVFRHGGKKLKKELEDLQAEYNMLEESRDTWKETCEALEKQTDVKAVRALRDQITSDNAHNERRIEALETQLGFEKTNREEAQNIARELRESLKKLKDELEEAVAKYENLQTSYEELDNMHGAEERANEDKDDEISELKAEHKRLEARFAALNERYLPRKKMRARDREDGDGDGGEDQGNHDDKPDSGNDDRDGPNEDDKNDDDDPDDGRNGGADKVATDADLAQEDVVNSPVLSGDTASSELPLKDGQRPTDLQTPNASPQRASFIMNGSAIEFVPSVRPKRPVPPLLPHHQAYTASQQGVNFSNSSSGSASPLPKFQAYSAAKPATLSPEVSVRGSIQNQYPFPELHDSAVPMHNELPAHTPAPKAAGPAEAKNAHIQKLNEEVKRLEWRRKSGMPDLVEDEDGVAVPDVVLDDMYDQQVIQFLNFTPIRCARGSVWGSLNDIPDPLENLSIPSTPSGSRVNLAGVPAMDPVEENVLASSSSEQSQENILPGRTACLQPSTTLPSKANPNPNVNEEMAPTTGDDLNQKASKKNDESIEAPINEMTPQTPDFDDSGMPEADEESGNGGEWSDVEADNQAEEDEGAPMLGKYKVTRGPAPVKSSSGMPMLGKYKVTRGKTLASNTSGALKAEEESGADGEWSDLEDEEDKEDEEEDKAEEEDAADATDEEDEQEGDAMPMLGSHKVTRGFTPINNNSGIAMLGNRQVTRGPTPAKISPGTPKAEEDSGYDSQPSSPCPAPKRGLPQQSLTTALPVLQSQSPSRKPPTAPAPTTDAPPPAAQEHASDGSNPEAAHDGHPNCRPSNIFPGTENATKTHDEDVGDAFADYVREHGSGKLEDSMWADKPDAKTQAIPQKLSSPTPGEDVKSPHTPNKFDDGEVSRAPPRGPANLRGLPKPQPPPGAPTGPRGHASRDPGRERSGSGIQTLVELEDPDTAPRVRLPTPRSCGIDNPDDTPRVRLPSQPKVSQAQPAPIIPDTCPSTQGELEDDSNPQAAPLGTQDARSFDPPAKPPYRASPLRNEVRGTPARKNDGGAQHRSAASPTGMAVGGDGWSPRGNGRGGRGGQGGQRGRGVRTPQKQNSTHGPFTKTPKVTPTRPAAEEDFKILGASTRGGSGGSDGQSGPGTSPRGRGGRDGYQASRQQQGPLQTSTPNTSRATTAATNNNKNNRTPPANRGSGQGGQTTPTPKPGSARGPGSANSSFQRWQDAMAKKAVEKEG